MKNAINITALSVLLFLLCSAASYSAPTTNRTTKAASASYSNTAAKTEKAAKADNASGSADQSTGAVKKGKLTFSGKVFDKKTFEPIEFATIVLRESEQWAVADKDGRFTIRNVPAGENVVIVSCLGYVTDTREVNLSRDISSYNISLAANDLTLEEVVVTAQENSSSAATSRTIDRTALDHIQMVNVADISALLPGGRTVNPDLTNQQVVNVRSEGTSEAGNSSFGTAIEVDGVRINNNASFSNLATGSGLKGITTNNIASSNVESVEVISGMPSVEYGDMGTGVVKINTRKGVTPWTVSMSTNPTMKQLSVSKGFGLRDKSMGVINASGELTKSISDPRSPYTAYTRRGATLTYSNMLTKGVFGDAPLRLTAGITGNIGGRNSEADPDSFKDTWSKTRDNTVRGNLSLNWLLSKPWITNVELNASISYSDKQELTRNFATYAAGSVALHGKEEGYFVAQTWESNPDAAITLIPRGSYYNTMGIDDRPMSSKVSFKANWARNFGKANNKVKIGADWSSDRNFGSGQYSEDMSTATTFRTYDYSLVPAMNNVAAYIEDNIVISLGKTRLNLIAGLRNDNSIIRGSAYGVTSSLSPRFNAKYTILSPKGRRQNLVKELALRASWGVAVKQPSYSVLYPVPTYRDIEIFVPTSSSDGSAYYAYFIMPKTINYNAALRWQQNRQAEFGLETDIAGNRISLTAYWNKTVDAYRMSTGYNPFSYNYTSAKELESNCKIPADRRNFVVDQKTGIVTVHDNFGEMESVTIPAKTKTGFNSNLYANNSTDPVTRWGLEWIVDFKRIKALNTSIRWDGSFYSYRVLDTQIEAYCPFTLTSTDGTPYKYVGYYSGGNKLTNGSISRNLRTNLTINTNIPQVRMVFSLRLEAGLIKYSRYLSEGADGKARTYVISNKDDVLSFTGEDIYQGNSYTVTFPETYSTIDDPTTRRDYLEDLKWARENNRAMYSDLQKLAISSAYLYYFNEDYISPYFTANISVTKEIGDFASVSFYANNFFNNLGQVHSSKTGSSYPIGNYIPSFFYGLSLRLKF